MSRISVIIPVRNGAATLRAALGSVLRSDAVGEVVVVDDGSTDGSADLANGMGDPRVRVVPGPCTGISDAFNAGLAAARLDYVLRCDADDLVVPDALPEKIDWLEAHPGHVAVSGAYASMTAKGRRLVDLADFGVPRDVGPLLLAGKTVTHFCTWLTRRQALLRIGGARSWFVTAEDLDLQFRLAREGAVWHDTRRCYLYRLHEASITHTQADGLRAFYEHTARAFARQRENGGADDLERGDPPAPGPELRHDGAPKTARAQAAGQLEGAAWSHHEQGRRREGFALLIRAISLDPAETRRWRGLAAMAMRLVR